MFKFVHILIGSIFFFFNNKVWKCMSIQEIVIIIIKWLYHLLVFVRMGIFYVFF